MSHQYVFTAIRGVQAGREYFVAMCPLKLIPKIFLFDELELRPEIRAQRVLNRSRVPEIARYLAENKRDYVLSSLTASIDVDVQFKSVQTEQGQASDVGHLLVPMSARFLLNDGQHRRAGIEEALKLRSDLGEESISIVFFVDAGLRRSQQMFADLNRHAVKPTQSIGILYDHRDSMSKLTRDVIDRVSVFRDMVEKEKTSISNRSTKLFTLSSIHQANQALLRKRTKRSTSSDADLVTAVDFWEAVAATIPEWRLAQQRKVAAAELREDRVHAHGLALHALAVMGAELLHAHPSDWKERIRRLSKIDWSRSNVAAWEGTALVNGRVSKAQVNVTRTSEYLKKVVGLTSVVAEARLVLETTQNVRLAVKKRRPCSGARA